MKLSWVQSIALYNVAYGRLPWERIRSAYKAPLTGDALKRKGLLRQDRGGWYELTQQGMKWIWDNPPTEEIRHQYEFPESMPEFDVETEDTQVTEY